MQLQYITIRKRMKNNLQEADRYFEQFQTQFPVQFVNNRLLIDDAWKHKVMAETNLTAAIIAELDKAAKKSNKSSDELLDLYGKDQKYVIYQLAERELIKELVDRRISPKVEVNAFFVSNTQEKVIQVNGAASTTNMHRRLMMEGWRREIASGKLDFHDLVTKKFNDGLFEIEDGGKWETVTFGEMDDKNFEEHVFSSDEGAVLPLQEDDDGINLLLVNKKIPVRRDKDGNILEREQAELLCVRMLKEPLLLRQSDEEMMKDLKNQMQLRAISDYVGNLKTNGCNKIVYPNGKELF
jgi:hypothetical protein